MTSEEYKDLSVNVELAAGDCENLPFALCSKGNWLIRRGQHE